MFFLSQALLQNGRLVRLGRDLRDHVIERLPDGALPADWPNPHWLGMPPRSRNTKPIKLHIKVRWMPRNLCLTP